MLALINFFMLSGSDMLALIIFFMSTGSDILALNNFLCQQAAHKWVLC